MKLKDLPQPIRELAEKRIREQGRDAYTSQESRLAASFTWGKTEDGQDFWEEIHKGNFDVFYKLNPVEFITKKIDQLDSSDLAKVAEYVNENYNVDLLCEVAVLEYHSFNVALPLIRNTRVQISTSPAILQSKCYKPFLF